MLSSSEAERGGILRVAELMAIAARTAPKARGMDYIKTAIVSGEELDEIASRMEEIAETTGLGFFKRDADCLRRSGALVLIGVTGSDPRGLNCGACGFVDCEGFVEARAKARRGAFLRGPSCAMALLDLGIAIGSAVKIASDMNVDNRVMFTAGVAALAIGLMEADAAIGIPLSATGKNIYFDRRPIQ